MLPGAFADTVDEAVDYDPSLSTDQAFMAVATEKGPSTPRRKFSLRQWVATFGAALQFSHGYNAAQLLYEEGTKAVVTQRVTGPNPVRASSIASNSSAAHVIQFEAVDIGEYGNSLTRQFVAGSGSNVQLIIGDASGPLMHSPDLGSQAAIVAWGNATGIVTVGALAGEGLPVTDGAAVHLAGGTDDHTHITNTSYGEALAMFDERMGPGQVILPGLTSEEAHSIAINHGVALDRIVLLDLPDSGDGATLTGNVATSRSHAGANRSAAFAGWVITPDGIEVPPAAAAAAKMAASDLATGNPNEPAAGDNGQMVWVTGLTQDFDAATREALDVGGVNPLYDVNGLGQIEVYDYDTLVDPEVDPLTTALSNARLDMLIRWHARKIGRSLDFKEVDPQGLLASRYNGLLVGMLKEYQGKGAIYGFSVDTASVNNATTASEEKLNARMKVQRSPYAKAVYLDVTNYAIGAIL